MTRITTKPCNSCGKDLVWGLADWPIEREPKPYGSQMLRAYVFIRTGPRAARAVDVRDVADPPDLVYPQHHCREWEEQRKQLQQEARRAEQILDRLLA